MKADGVWETEKVSQVHRAGVEGGRIEIAREAEWVDERNTLSSWKGLWDRVGSGGGLCFGAWVQVVKKIANEYESQLFIRGVIKQCFTPICIILLNFHESSGGEDC